MTNKKNIETIQSILDECDRQGLPLVTQKAYVLATVEHETNNTFRPVVESYWLDNPDQYNKKHHPEYYPFYGRGYVQLTWRKNYAYYGELLNMPLVEQPEIALREEVARFVLVHGFKHGIFTGHRLVDYVNTNRTWFKNARRCINGTDKAAHIAGLARAWQGRLWDVVD